MKNKTQQLKEKIREYVSDVKLEKYDVSPIEKKADYRDKDGYRMIRLEDVLITLDKDWKWEADDMSLAQELLNSWKLNQPLENQSDKLKEFLFEILCEK